MRLQGIFVVLSFFLNGGGATSRCAGASLRRGGALSAAITAGIRGQRPHTGRQRGRYQSCDGVLVARMLHYCCCEPSLAAAVAIVSDVRSRRAERCGGALADVLFLLFPLHRAVLFGHVFASLGILFARAKSNRRSKGELCGTALPCGRSWWPALWGRGNRDLLPLSCRPRGVSGARPPPAPSGGRRTVARAVLGRRRADIARRRPATRSAS